MCLRGRNLKLPYDCFSFQKLMVAKETEYYQKSNSEQRLCQPTEVLNINQSKGKEWIVALHKNESSL
jgi:hypothetical protein